MHSAFDLFAAARDEMIPEGFEPDFPPAAQHKLDELKDAPEPLSHAGVEDLRSLRWSSIDNDTSRDLDQAEVAERVSGGIGVLVAVADVDSAVPLGSPIDRQAAAQATSVYTGVRTFPMLPEELSTDLTSLDQDVARLGVVMDMVVALMARSLPAEFIGRWCAIARS
jgi:exoribonuclease R